MRALLRDYLATAAVQWAVLGAGLLLFHLVARRSSGSGFAYYQIARGVVATAQPVAMLGMAPGLHRYLPRAPESARRLARQALVVQLLAAAVVVVAGVACSRWIQELLGLSGSAPAVAVLLAGNCLCTLAVASLRGNGQVLWSNLATFTGLAAIPLATWYAVKDVDTFLVAQGIGMTGVALLATFAVRHRSAAPPPHGAPHAESTSLAAALVASPELAVIHAAGTGTVSDGLSDPIDDPLPDGAAARPLAPGVLPVGSPSIMQPGTERAGDAGPGLLTLVRYGLRRTPGDLALPALLAFPTFAVANALPRGPEAGYVGFTASGVTFICSFYAMLTPVLLPRLSAHFHSPGDTKPNRLLTILPIAAAALAAVVAVALILAAPKLIHAYLGAEFGGAVRTLRLGVLAAIPFAAFYAARPTLDALQDVPVLTYLVLVTLVLEIVLSLLLKLATDPLTAALAALDLAALFLGSSAFFTLFRALRP